MSEQQTAEMVQLLRQIAADLAMIRMQGEVIAARLNTVSRVAVRWDATVDEPLARSATL